MEIFFSPECNDTDHQILNVVDGKNRPVGYLSVLFSEKKVYVYGHLENDGVREDFKDMVLPYIRGITKLKPDLDVYTYLSAGGQKLELEKEGESS